MPTFTTALDGTIQSGVVFILFPSMNLIGATAERSNSPSGPFTVIGTVDDLDQSGTAYFDLLPHDGIIRYYRFKQTEPGYNDGPYTEIIAAVPSLIPSIDWANKPWLQQNLIPLQLVMDVFSETATTLHVTASVNRDPANLGTPTVSIESYFGIPSSPTPTGSNGWVVTKPASGFGRATFSNALAGRIGDVDSIDIQAASSGSASDWLVLGLNVSASSAAWLGVSASVANTGAGPTNVSVIASNNVGTITSLGGNRWNINRPTTGVGSVTFQVTGSTGIISDTDTIYVSKDPNPYLNVSAVATGTNSGSVSCSVFVRDSQDTTSAPLLGITLTSSSNAGITITHAGVNNSAGLQQHIVYISRPVYGAGTGRATFFANKTGYTQDSDALEIPESVANLARLRTVVTQTQAGADNIIVSASSVDPLGTATPSMSYAIQPPNSVTVTGTNPYTITYPSSGSTRFTVTGFAANRIADSDAIDIPGRSVSLLEGVIRNINTTPTLYTFQVTGSDYAGGAAPTITATSASGVTPLTIISSSTVLSGSSPSVSWSYQAIGYSATRPSPGASLVQYNFATRKTGRQADNDWITIEPQATGSGGTSGSSEPPIVPAFITSFGVTSVDTGGDNVNLAWQVTNAPTPATYSLSCVADSVDLGAITLYTSTSFHQTRTGSLGHGINLVAFGTAVDFTYLLQVRDNYNRIVGSIMTTTFAGGSIGTYK